MRQLSKHPNWMLSCCPQRRLSVQVSTQWLRLIGPRLTAVLAAATGHDADQEAIDNQAEEAGGEVDTHSQGVSLAPDGSLVIVH